MDIKEEIDKILNDLLLTIENYYPKPKPFQVLLGANLNLNLCHIQ